jgi:hypothetical protein
MHGYKALAAMGKTLEYNGGNRTLGKQEGGRTRKTDKQLFHTRSHVSMLRIVQWSPLGRQVAHQRRGAADCGEYRAVAGAPDC